MKLHPPTSQTCLAVFAVALVLLNHGCANHPASSAANQPASTNDDSHVIECRNGVVVSVSGPASDAGLSILKQGGNAVDAAIATAFALEVAYPLAGNLGGGGFMVVHPAPRAGAPVVFDYRETAPAAATATMFTKDESQFTHKCVATPGTVRGMALAHRRFGTMPWPRLLAPAIELAKDGFIVDGPLAKSINETLAASPQFTELQRVYGKPGGGLWTAGDRFVQPDLARTLQILSDQGPDAFYKGPIAAAILDDMSRSNGLINATDLANYQAIERAPLSTRYRGEYDVYVPPPPCAGGTCLLEELNMLDTFDVKSWGRWSPRTVHVMAEIMRRANRDRALYLGDPAFNSIPDKLIAPAYGHELAKTIEFNHATRSRELAGDIPMAPESPSTTQLSIIDRNGMAVANTYTLERRWGSRIVVKNMGFLLNNDMRAFNLFPGVTDTNGTVGTTPNLIAPGKRPISSMTPTIVARNGRVVLVTGSPGSRAIPHTVLEIMSSVLDFNMSLSEAVEAPRFTHEWFPDHISFEHAERFPELVKSLNEMGHTIVPPAPLPFQGDAHSILVRKTHDYIGVADRRINGKASGY